MGKKILFTVVLFIVTFTTFAQITVDPLVDETTYKAADIPGRIDNIISGNFNVNTNSDFIQLRGNETLPNISSDHTFTLQTSSGTIDANLNFNIKKYFGNSGSIKIYIDGYATETFQLPSINSTVDDFENHNLIFSQTVTISTTPINVKFEIVNIAMDQATIRPGLRFYDVNIDNVNITLSVDEYIPAHEAGINLYPNPVTNSFKIDSNKNIENVKLYNVTGNLSKTFNAKTNYDISDLAAGIYFTIIKTQSGSSILKIIKN